MNLAPIGVSTYKRKEHLAASLSALSQNPLARESELFIFSDAPRPGDEQAVGDVRQMIRNVSGFKKVRVVERETNDRVANNRGGMRFLLSEFGKMIFLEEDVVTAPAFLGFMNEGLATFKHQKEIFAMCGYTPPVGLENIINSNTYSCRRFAAWGFGTWADRFDCIEFGQVDSSALSRLQHRRLRSAGTDLLRMVEQLSAGEIEALDVRINFTLAKRNFRVVCPTTSLTLNRGHDGTGIHCPPTQYYETALEERESVQWNFGRVYRSWKIDKALYFYRGRHRKSRKNLIRYHLARRIEMGR